MMRSRNVLFAVIAMLGEVLACAVLGWLLIGETLMTTGFDALLGQVYLTRESAPISGRESVSTEVLLGELAASDDVGARLVILPEEVYLWGPAYAGFAQARLTADEAHDLIAAMAAGPLFTSSDTLEILCVEGSGVGQPVTAPCAVGTERQQIHDEIRMSASRAPGMAVLQLRFPDGRLAEYELYLASGVLAYSAVEVNEPDIHGYLSSGGDRLAPLLARASIPPAAVLWPEQTAARANARAARRLGRRYREAVEFVSSLETLRQVVGEVQEIRPVEGEAGNWSSAWMDSSSLQLLLRVTGDQGEGVVRMSGWECWEAEMMAAGRLVELTPGIVCPEP
jgi:hypothetical protein